MATRRTGEPSGNDWLSNEDSQKQMFAQYKNSCHVGLYGWRRRCLFALVTILLFFVILNLSLTLWIIKVMDFSIQGLGPLKVFLGGIQLRGEALVLDKLIATKLRSRKGQVMQIEGSRNISLNARSASGRLTSQLLLGENSLEAIASSLKLTDSQGRTIFSADKKEVLIGAESLGITGEGGVVFQGSLQTPKVKADSGHELRLESPTRSLDIFGTFGVNLVSGAGDISVTALSDLKLQSQGGTVKLEAPNIYLPMLETVNLSSKPKMATGPNKAGHTVYQLCICQRGRLFLTPPDGDCVADNDVCR